VIDPPSEPPVGKRPVHGRVTVDASLPMADVFGFFHLPKPQHDAATLGDWMTQALARDSATGDGIDWHGAHFRIDALHEGRIARVGIVLARRSS